VLAAIFRQNGDKALLFVEPKVALLIKLDDYYYAERSDIWPPLLRGLNERGVVPALGVIAGRSLKNYRAGCREGSWLAESKFDLFNHGFHHDVSEGTEFGTPNLQQQIKLLALANDAIREIFETGPSVFGAPRNAYNQHTAEACAACGLTAAYLYRKDSPGSLHPHRVDAIWLDRLFAGETIKSPSTLPNLTEFRDLRGKRFAHYCDIFSDPGQGTFCIMQLHPSRWSPGSVGSFLHLFDNFARNKFRFVSQQEAILRCKKLHVEPERAAAE